MIEAIFIEADSYRIEIIENYLNCGRDWRLECGISEWDASWSAAKNGALKFGGEVGHDDDW